jgi:tetratricopeptide (TPR) repeat protein
MAIAYFFMKNKKKCREFSKRGIECIIKGYGSLDSYMSYKPERPLRIRQIVMLTYFQGETDEALKLLSQVKSCDFCYFCNFSDCYDYYLTLARIMEMEKETDKALGYYKKAFEMSPGDMEVFRAIQVLERE